MNDLTNLLAALVQIDSVNPALGKDAPGERAMARFVYDWCVEHDLETHWLEATPGRPSVVALARGSGEGYTLLLNGHTDTVGVEGMETPFTPHITGKRMSGRGSCDMKAGLAAAMLATAFARQQRLSSTVILTAVADEEHGSIGSSEVLAFLRGQGIQPDGAIVTEPSALDLCVAHRGFAVFDVTAYGLAAHTSQPEGGANAITLMGRILAGVERQDQQLRQRSPHPLLGHGSLQATLIEGGSALFTMPAECRASIERRTLPGESLAQICHELDMIVAEAIGNDAKLQATIETMLIREPFECPADVPLLNQLRQVVTRHRQTPPALVGAPYWMDSALIQAAGIPTVIFGPSGGGMHALDEWVDLESVEVCARVLCEFIRVFTTE